MSATFKIDSKKKVSQNDLRRLMAEHKNKLNPTPKINNPLAKYNELGQLMCILCKSIVKSENVWPVHINSKQHKANIEEAKRLKEQTKNFTEPVKLMKRPAASPQISTVPEKKLKSILKNSNGVKPSVPNEFFDVKSSPKQTNVFAHSEEIKRAQLKDFPEKKESKPNDEDSNMQVDDAVPGTSHDAPIPEGFFDDPILDAKARNIEYKDPIEEEWEKFQKEIKEQSDQSAAIIACEQEEATNERQIEEIEEQMRNWNRVLELELKKEETSKKLSDPNDVNMNDKIDSSSDSEADIDEFLDWRSKKSYR